MSRRWTATEWGWNMEGPGGWVAQVYLDGAPQWRVFSGTATTSTLIAQGKGSENECMQRAASVLVALAT